MIAGVSLSTVKKIAKEGRDIEDGQSLDSRPLTRDIKNHQKFIYNLYLTEQQVSTIKKIHNKFVEEMNYTGSKESMRNGIS